MTNYVTNSMIDYVTDSMMNM